MRKKVLYIMGIDWTWAYQRPQILAEYLAKDFDVTVAFPRSIYKIKHQNIHSDFIINFRVIRTIPLQERNSIIGKISFMLNKKIFSDIYKYDFVWVGYPLYKRYIPGDYKGFVVYDCVDNYESFLTVESILDKVLLEEKRLVDRCDFLLTSADKLKKKMDNIAGFSKSILVRNGTFVDKLYKISYSEKNKDKYTLGYVGTISEWFDYETILSDVKGVNIEYKLIGPVKDKVSENRISYIGCVKHDDIYDNISDCDALIMPFKVNDIVSFVDPVKLYEYICFGKCIISVWYEEIDRFKDFVYFYNDTYEYIELIKKLTNNGFTPKYTDKYREEFLKNNSWDSRYIQIKEILK